MFRARVLLSVSFGELRAAALDSPAASVSAVMTDEIERGNAVVIAGDSFAVDNAGTRTQPGKRINDQREAAGEVITRTAVKPHLRALLAGNDAEAVMLDFMQPLAAGGRLIGFGWKERRDEPYAATCRPKYGWLIATFTGSKPAFCYPRLSLMTHSVRRQNAVDVDVGPWEDRDTCRFSVPIGGKIRPKNLPDLAAKRSPFSCSPGGLTGGCAPTRRAERRIKHGTQNV